MTTEDLIWVTQGCTVKREANIPRTPKQRGQILASTCMLRPPGSLRRWQFPRQGTAGVRGAGAMLGEGLEKEGCWRGTARKPSPVVPSM